MFGLLIEWLVGSGHQIWNTYYHDVYNTVNQQLSKNILSHYGLSTMKWWSDERLVLYSHRLWTFLRVRDYVLYSICSYNRYRLYSTNLSSDHHFMVLSHSGLVANNYRIFLSILLNCWFTVFINIMVICIPDLVSLESLQVIQLIIQTYWFVGSKLWFRKARKISEHMLSPILHRLSWQSIFPIL